MTIPVQIVNGGVKKYKATVTKNGQLIVAPFGYNKTQFFELAEPDTAYNFYKPLSGHNFILTGFIAKADKQVSSTVDADVIIYEATSETTTTVSDILFESAMVQGDLIQAVGLNVLVSEGVFLNAKTTDDDIHMTIMGYYIPTL